jgi:membrane-associated phospholipid phosphatase
VAGGVFLALLLVVSVLTTVPGDEAVRQALLAPASPGVLGFMHAINYVGSWRVLLPATLLLLLAFRRARARWWLWVGLMIAAPSIEGLLKILVGRARPEDASMGFPSGHATASAAFFVAMIYLAEDLPSIPRRALRAAAVVVLLLVALARVLLRAHWPSDALAGMCLGATLASAAFLLDRRLAP